VQTYLLRRILAVIPVMVVVATVTFVLIHLAPGDPASVIAGPDATPGDVVRLRHHLGLDEPLPAQLVRWYGRLLRGDLGDSIFLRRPVTEAIVERLEPTLLLTSWATLIAVLIGVPAGIVSARYHNTAVDQSFMGLALIGLSVPNFFFALLGIFFIGVKLKWLPIFGMWTPGQPTTVNLDLVRHAILPVTALTISHIAGYMRYARAATLDALAGDYVTTARAKGLREGVVLWVHVFRNALLPLVTIAGLALPALIGGSFIIETLFSWPGIGLLGYTAILQRDYPLQMGIALLSAVAVLLANLLTDLAYAFVDPRIRYD